MQHHWQKIGGIACAVMLSTLSSCTWVEVDEHGINVQALARGEPPPDRCQSKGQVEVSVLHEISFYERDDEKISKELLTLARNEAGLMGANVIQAQQAPKEGRQRFDAYHCP
ncbi:MAG: DUF4156 domain-containing protein [Xanthomonadales bacterium]|nr:DUF4156 domain-containing protein [Xanthomonadales bacterium]